MFEVDPPPVEKEPDDPGMVHFEHTPVRVILELVDRTALGPESIFYDLGAGMGHVIALVHLLTGATCIGVEIEPAYCAYARRCLRNLGLEKVSILQADARHVDYAAGHLFFMFTPFTGAIWCTVLRQLEEVARRREIQVCTYGPCTRWLAHCSWLVSVDEHFDDEFKLAIFHSR